jgi:diadenosine tetraphosphate (Ap4A) HIT family hydrolase
MTELSDCPYCRNTTDQVIWSDGVTRVMYIDDAPFVGWCRVIWHAHALEMTDLSETERNRLMRTVYAVETGLRKLLLPAKINLASMGTAMPHVHWHIVPRFPDDTHFPDPVWSSAKRAPSGRTVPPDFVGAMQAHLATVLA